MSAPIRVRTISAAEHLAWVQAQPAVSFLQTPAWGRVKTDWRSESVGWFEGETLRAAALVLYRKVPKAAKFLAYLPEGPALDWGDARIVEYLAALRAHLSAQGAFAIRLGPTVVVNRWGAETIKAAVADPAVTRLAEVTPDVSEPLGPRVVGTLEQLGFRSQAAVSYTHLDVYKRQLRPRRSRASAPSEPCALGALRSRSLRPGDECSWTLSTPLAPSAMPSAPTESMGHDRSAPPGSRPGAHGSASELTPPRREARAPQCPRVFPAPSPCLLYTSRCV